MKSFLSVRRLVATIVVCAASALGVLLVGRSHSEYSATGGVRLATSDPTCLFLRCPSNLAGPTPGAYGYTAGQVAWIKSYGFARAVSQRRPSLGLSPEAVWLSVDASQIGASRTAQITAYAKDPKTATALVTRYREEYVAISKTQDLQKLDALPNRLKLRPLYTQVVTKAEDGTAPDRGAGASLSGTVAPPTPARARSRIRILAAMAAAALAAALIVLGGFALWDARRRSRLGHQVAPSG
jgi:hypothetical protein